MNRRQALQGVGAQLLLRGEQKAAESALRVQGQDVEIQIAPVSEHTLRLTIIPIKDGETAGAMDDGSLVQSSWGSPVARLRGATPAQTVRCGALRIRVSPDPLTFVVETSRRSEEHTSELQSPYVMS